MRTKRCARNALYTFDTRRFNRQFTASGFQSFDHRRNLAAGFRKLLRSNEVLVQDIAAQFKVNRSTLYRSVTAT
jgi:hypothetical protein